MPCSAMHRPGRPTCMTFSIKVVVCCWAQISLFSCYINVDTCRFVFRCSILYLFLSIHSAAEWIADILLRGSDSKNESQFSEKGWEIYSWKQQITMAYSIFLNNIYYTYKYLQRIRITWKCFIRLQKYLVPNWNMKVVNIVTVGSRARL